MELTVDKISICFITGGPTKGRKGSRQPAEASATNAYRAHASGSAANAGAPYSGATYVLIPAQTLRTTLKAASGIGRSSGANESAATTAAALAPSAPFQAPETTTNTVKQPSGNSVTASCTYLCGWVAALVIWFFKQPPLLTSPDAFKCALKFANMHKKLVRSPISPPSCGPACRMPVKKL